jgi:N6-L-threonylcarbamoyladenine synthase
MLTFLGIETSCDETSAAIVVDGHNVLSNVVASQVDLHSQYGGVFPEIASRAHVEHIYPVVKQALKDAKKELSEVNAIAVTRGPGLAGSLVVGVNMAKGLASGSNIPLLAINHLEGHIYSLWATEPHSTPIDFPLVVLIVSGGHTELILMSDHGQFRRLGHTLDDAAGEAFDKVGRLLGLPYPGGPSIQEASRTGNPDSHYFPRAWLGHDSNEENYNFSFSGLKTATLRTLQELVKGYQIGSPLPAYLPIADLAASFQAAVVDVLVHKTIRAATRFEAREIFVAGGVSANIALRSKMIECSPVPVRVPTLSLCTDNAAMIAAAGYFRFEAGQRDSLNFDVLPSWSLS